MTLCLTCSAPLHTLTLWQISRGAHLEHAASGILQVCLFFSVPRRGFFFSGESNPATDSEGFRGTTRGLAKAVSSLRNVATTWREAVQERKAGPQSIAPRA